MKNHPLAKEVRQILNRCYLDQSPGRISSQTYTAVWNSPMFHTLTLVEFRAMLRTGEARRANNIGPVALEQLRRAFGVRGEYRKKVNQ